MSQNTREQSTFENKAFIANGARVYKNMKKNKDDYFLIVLILFCVGYSTFLALSRDTFYFVSGDTAGYQISSLSELSTIHRTPGLQLISLLFYKVFNSNWEYANIAMVCFQHIILVVGVAFLYKSICLYTKQHIYPFVISVMTSIVLFLYGFPHALLTESYAVAIMCIQIWCIVKTVSEEKTRYTIVALILGCVCTMIRPSHILTLMIISGFVIIYGLFNHHWIIKKGLLTAGVCWIMVFGLCGINKIHYGYFGISDVKPLNDMATLLYADTVENTDYIEITEYVKSIQATEDSNWSKAKNILNRFGYDDTKQYISSSKKQNMYKYIQYNLDDLKNNAENWIVFDYARSYGRINKLINVIHKFVFPFTFGFIWIATSVCVLLTIGISVMRKKMLWVELGICLMILSIEFSSRIACHTDTLVRTAVHALPCIFFLYAIYWKWLSFGVKNGWSKWRRTTSSISVT